MGGAEMKENGDGENSSICLTYCKDFFKPKKCNLSTKIKIRKKII
jgi:hypothetical protein